jgi:hypothetical protein
MPVEQARAFELAPALVWRRWGEETVVYVEHNFKTHLLNWVGGLILDAMLSAAKPCTSRELSALLMADDSPADGEFDEGWLDPVLEQLLAHQVIVARAW